MKREWTVDRRFSGKKCGKRLMSKFYLLQTASSPPYAVISYAVPQNPVKHDLLLSNSAGCEKYCQYPVPFKIACYRKAKDVL